MLESEFFEKYSLNDEQIKALKEINGAVLVTAGAGSGKTRLLTRRIAYLISVCNVAPYNLLAITFTNKAANEMKNRVEDICQTNDVWISTFHSMCVKILRQNISQLEGFNSNFSIYSETDTDKVLKDIFAKHNISDDKEKKEVKFHISNCKNYNIDIQTYRLENSYIPNIDTICEIYNEYQTVLKNNNALDFDDLLIKTYELFKNKPEVLDKYSNRFRYVLVDEFQDTNKVQYELVKMLGSKHGNIFVVGDEDQCIYTWRGASFKNIFDFKKQYPDVKIFKLERNYRSTKPIIEVANKLIKNNRSRLDKVLWTDKESNEEVVFQKLSGDKEEAEFVASTIHKFVFNYGYSYNDFAVLLRLNALTLPFEEKMLSYNIPHKIYGGFKFYERQEIKNILAYLRLFVNPKDDISFIRIINFPKRGIGDASISKLRQVSIKNKCSLLEACFKLEADSANIKFINFAKKYIELLKDFEQTSLEEFVVSVIENYGIKFAYLEKEEDIEKAMNVDAFIKSVSDFAVQNPDFSLSDYLANISLISDIDTLGDDGSVTIATVHAVKGLEFKVVFLCAVEEGIFPLQRAINNGSNDLEEERRLMYVGITRAKEKLFTTCTSTRFLYGRYNYETPSRFLNESGIVSTSGYAYAKKEIEEKPKFTFNFNTIKNIEKEEEKPKINTSIYAVGQKVFHTKFGVGEIVAIDNDKKFGDINFATFGKKTLLLEIAPLKIMKE